MHDIGYFLRCAAEDLGWDYQVLRGGWLHELRKGGLKHYVIGYSFPHNSNTAARVAMDKVATYTVLSAAGMTPSSTSWCWPRGKPTGDSGRLCHEASRDWPGCPPRKWS